MVSTSEKRLNNINVVCEDKLNRKTAHFRLPSVAQKRCMLKLSNDNQHRPTPCDEDLTLVLLPVVNISKMILDNLDEVSTLMDDYLFFLLTELVEMIFSSSSA